MDKGLTVTKWVLIIGRKYPKYVPQNLSAQIVCPSPKVMNFNEKRLHWVSVVGGQAQKAKATYTKLCCKRNYVLLYLTLFRNEKHKTILKILIMKNLENSFVFLPVFYLIMCFMKALKNSGKKLPF